MAHRHVAGRRSGAGDGRLQHRGRTGRTPPRCLTRPPATGRLSARWAQPVSGTPRRCLTTGLCWSPAAIGPSGHLTDAEIFDPATDSWSPAGSLSNARNRHTATLMPDGRVLAAGGENDSGNVAIAELYDPDTDSWSATDDLDTARILHTATLLPGGTVMVTGGGGAGTLSSAEVYDPDAGLWTWRASCSMTGGGMLRCCCRAVRCWWSAVRAAVGCTRRPSCTFRASPVVVIRGRHGSWAE